MSIFGGGGSSGGGGGSVPATTTQYIREAPGIEERKLGLMDTAASLAQTPINIPAVQAQGLTGLENQGITASGVTGLGAPTTGLGITAVQNALAGPNINQFLNPYQSYVTDEIGRQGQIMQNQLSAQAVNQGAFGGGREGVQQAELQNRILEAQGRANAQGFGTALGAAQRQQQLGMAAGQQLGNLGAGQQQMAQADINQLMASGGIQQQLAQQALDAQRQTTLQQQYEPYQRAEFLANLYAAGPKSQSGITMTTQPGTSPLAQSIGTGLGAFTAYQAGQQQ